MAEESQLRVEQDGEVVVVGFNKPTLLNSYHVNETAKELYHLIEKQGCRWIVLDLSTIKILSSLTLGILLNARQKLENTGGKMVISGMDPKLSRVFKITHLDSVFEFFPDTSSAIERLKKNTRV